jgi:TolB-like protein/Tfp pilus assembly protein PilF
LFEELKRRNVIRVGIAYLAVAWLIAQVVETILPLFGFDETPARIVVIVLAIGFIPALVFAWAFELTPEGLKKDGDVDRSGPVSPRTGRKLDRMIMVVLALALGYFAVDKFVLDPRRDAASIEAATEEAVEQAFAEAAAALPEHSIAVLPFRNRSANEENAEFFSDGVHDELLTNLSRIRELKVISRTSVMNYRDTTKNLRQIGEELGVAKILEGGVQRAGETVRINVQLIDASTDDHLWAEVYDRQLSAENIFAIQTEIALAIANALEATLSPREQELLAILPTANLEAYDNFLMARQLLERSNWQSLRDAQSHLKKVIELDPEFVQAYVLLARTYFGLVGIGAATLQEINEPWRDAVQTALSLDENSASAHAVHAQFLWENGLEGTGDAFEKARQLEPANVDILGMYAAYQRLTYDFDRALQLYQLARELDPLSIPVLFGLARIYELRRETDKALELYAKIRQIDPGSAIGIGPAAGVYVLIGDMVQTLNWLFKALKVDPDDSDIYNWVALAYVDFGDYASAGQWLSWIGQTQNANPMNFSSMAMLNIHEGDVEAAIRYTRQAFEDQLPNRWGSDSVHLRTLLIWALDKGQTGAALKIARNARPELFEKNPAVDAGNVLQAINVAHLLQRENNKEQAVNLLQAAIAAYEKPYAVSEAWHASGKAQALTLLGEKKAALIELRHQVDEGWRLFWRWETALNPNFESLREEPEFQEIVEFLRADMARQYEKVQAMEAAGEIPSPPGNNAL